MATFRFFLIGAQQAPVVEVDAANVRELAAYMAANRFIEGQVVDAGEPFGVLIATSRIQMVSEAE